MRFWSNFKVIYPLSDRFFAKIGKLTGLTLTLLSLNALHSDSALGAGFTRQDQDINNPFYDLIDSFQTFSRTESEAIDANELGARVLDSSQLMINYDQEVTVFFINEGAGYRNQLGVTATGTTEFSQILFSDLTCLDPDCSHTGYRSPINQFGTPDGKPLEIGDYYNLGLIEAGTQLDFFLRRDGFGKAKTDIFYTATDRNPDGLQHVIAYDYQDYLILAWEDLYGGGDRDYNDVVFALEIGEENLEALPEIEEINLSSPSWLLQLAIGVGLMFYRRR